MKEKQREKSSKPRFEGLEGLDKGWRRLQWRKNGSGEKRGGGEGLEMGYGWGFYRKEKMMGARAPDSDNRHPSKPALPPTCKDQSARAPARHKGTSYCTKVRGKKPKKVEKKNLKSKLVIDNKALC